MEREPERPPPATAAPTRPATPKAPGAPGLRALQRRLGNRATAGLLQRAARGTLPLPAGLRARAERLSGLALDDVRVTADSPLPGAIGARAYARGAEIHLGPGESAQLPHETWHVVQQRRGAVRPTGTTADGTAINADPALEREADAMAARVVRADAPAPAHDAAPSAAAPPGPAGPPVLQGRWLVDDHGKLFWEDEPDRSKEDDEPPPGFEDAEIVAAPKPDSYQVNDGVTRLRRTGKSLAHTPEQWLAEHRDSTRKPSGNTYNPFGRFATSPSAFIPDPGFDDTKRKAILTALEEKDPNYHPVPPLEHGESYPPAVVVVTRSDGEKEPQKLKLPRVSVTRFGASYGLQADVPSAKPVKNPGPEEKLKLTAAPQAYKIASGRVTPAMLKAFTGKKREKSQLQVMGTSAADVAENAGYARDAGQGWEWLHMIAHSMGGIFGVGPQDARNLVAGTSECNTQMIVVEDWIKDMIHRTEGAVRLVVQVEMADPVRHIGKQIVYDFNTYNKDGGVTDVYHFVFDPLSRTTPLVPENIAQRMGSRQALTSETKAATKVDVGGSDTAHRDVSVWQELEKRSDTALGAFEKDPADAKGFVHQLEKLVKDGQDVQDLLVAVGERLEDIEQLARYVDALDRGSFERYARRALLWSFVYERRNEGLRDEVFKRFVVPYYKSGEVPAAAERLYRFPRSEEAMILGQDTDDTPQSTPQKPSAASGSKGSDALVKSPYGRGKRGKGAKDDD